MKKPNDRICSKLRHGSDLRRILCKRTDTLAENAGGKIGKKTPVDCRVSEILRFEILLKAHFHLRKFAGGRAHAVLKCSNPA